MRQVLSRAFTKKGAERMGFLFTWKMTGRSKDFQLRYIQLLDT